MLLPLSSSVFNQVHSKLINSFGSVHGKDRKMAHVTMASTEEAIDALVVRILYFFALDCLQSNAISCQTSSRCTLKVPHVLTSHFLCIQQKMHNYKITESNHLRVSFAKTRTSSWTQPLLGVGFSFDVTHARKALRSQHRRLWKRKSKYLSKDKTKHHKDLIISSFANEKKCKADQTDKGIYIILSNVSKSTTFLHQGASAFFIKLWPQFVTSWWRNAF